MVQETNIKRVAPWTLSIALLMASELAMAKAPSLWNMTQIKLDNGPHTILPETELRVRIFPHPRDYPPHGIDRTRDEIAFISSTPCRYYEGAVDRPAKLPVLLAIQSTLEFTAESLDKPAWIECDTPVTVIRPGKKVGYQYNGSLYVRRIGDGPSAELEVINTIEMEEYLRGVVPSEVYSGWPMESLKSQAVAARTYAVFHLAYALTYPNGRFYDVDDTVVYQAYTGVSGAAARTDEAIVDTRGQILTYDRQVIQAYYHADSGGQTEGAEDVWLQTVPYCKGQKETYDPALVQSSWQIEVDMHRLANNLRARGLLTRKDKIATMSVPRAGRTPSGRVKFVSLSLQDGTTKNITIRDFKRNVGAIPATLFNLAKSAEKPGTHYVISGRGTGHGVGMSQRGAAALATQNWNYRRILKFYYSGINICSLDGKKGKGKVPGCYKPKPAVKQDDHEGSESSPTT